MLHKALLFSLGFFFCFRYCGRSIPPSLTSGGNVMMLYFVTDRSISSEGFSANYISLDASKGNMPVCHYAN